MALVYQSPVLRAAKLQLAGIAVAPVASRRSGAKRGERSVLSACSILAQIDPVDGTPIASDQRVAPVMLLLLIVACGCSRSAAFPEDRPTPAEAAPEPTTAPALREGLPRGASRHAGVSTYSSLPALFDGQVGSRLLLRELPSREPLVGVGSLSDLRGEIAIFDGEIWVSYPDGSAARRTRDEQAAFLAVARVDAWHEVTLARAITWQELPDELAEHGRASGFSRDEPMAIHIEGRVEAIEYNIVNGPALGVGQGAPRPLSKEELSKTAAKRSVPAEQVKITGFYARENAEAFIHPGETLHLHVILPEAEQMGHLDHVTLPQGVVVKLGRPVPERQQATASFAQPQ